MNGTSGEIMKLDSFAEIINACADSGKSFPQIVAESNTENFGIAPADAYTRMRAIWRTMLDSVKNYDPADRSASGLSGGDGGKMDAYAVDGAPLCGDYLADVMACALKTAESNACMKRIAAAPTAGACGVLPAVLLPLYRRGLLTEDDAIDALFVSTGIGSVIAERASMSGAEAGCQAEIGAASAMAAGTLVYIRKGSPAQIAAAAGIALQNLMGLVCDPVAGLVEVPCVKRNAAGAVNACAAADMALAGITSRIPPDQIVDAMGAVGRRLDESLRETGRGGLAATPEGKRIAQEFYK